MSQSELERFVADVKANKELQDALKEAGPDVDAIVKYASGKGYDFTADELKAYAQTKKGELSEEELEKVAGGVVAGAVEVVVGAVVAAIAT